MAETNASPSNSVNALSLEGPRWDGGGNTIDASNMATMIADYLKDVKEQGLTIDGAKVPRGTVIASFTTQMDLSDLSASRQSGFNSKLGLSLVNVGQEKGMDIAYVTEINDTGVTATRSKEFKPNPKSVVGIVKALAHLKQKEVSVAPNFWVKFSLEGRNGKYEHKVYLVDSIQVANKKIGFNYI